jgi:cyclopropane fatty-acyl-phospholipid synthase-like methyltransferase
MFDSLVNAMRRFKPIDRYKFRDTQHYWERRYRKGRTSGTEGAFDPIAGFKSEVLNQFVKNNDVESIIDFGSGDGYFLTYCRFPEYAGYETSPTAIEQCREFFALKAPKWQFFDYADYAGEQADMAMSIDVIDYIVEDHMYLKHMRDLFRAGRKYVAIYACNTDSPKTLTAVHFRRRRFTDWIEDNVTNWEIVKEISSPFPVLNNTSFYVYRKVDEPVPKAG